MTEQFLRRVSEPALVSGYLSVSLDDLALQITSGGTRNPNRVFEPGLDDLLSRVLDERRALLRAQRHVIEAVLVDRVPADAASSAFEAQAKLNPACARGVSFALRGLWGLGDATDLDEERLLDEVGRVHGVLLNGRVPALMPGGAGTHRARARRTLARALLVAALNPEHLDSENISWITVGPRVRHLTQLGLAFGSTFTLPGPGSLKAPPSEGVTAWDVSA